MSEPGSGWVEQGVGRIVAYVGRSERHRVGFVIGVSLLFFLVAVVNSYFGGLIPLIFNVVLVVFLYTRASAQATVTASATGPGFIYLVFYLYRVIGPFEEPIGGYEPFISILLRESQLLVIGILLLMLGAWLSRITS
ncbi:hypothetical protein [Haloarcula amylolytica]|uniref:hypothetical protein n=1 Tax=Haloarcula amylolytica TaxID=396317 RepID=UPI003C754758